MKTFLKEPTGGVTLKPCQVCYQLKVRFHLCDRGHSTCCDCRRSRTDDVRQLAQRFDQLKNRSPSRSDRLASSEGSPSDELRSNFAFRSPIRSLMTTPEEDSDSRRLSVPRAPKSSPAVTESRPNELQVFCEACGGFTEAILVNLPANILKLAPQSSDQIEAAQEPVDVEDEPCIDHDDAVSEIHNTSVEPNGREVLKKDVTNLRCKLVTAYSEVMNARRDLGEVGQKTGKLGLDVEMLRGGVNFLYFNFDVILKNKEVWIAERVCGIPFVVMARLRRVSRVPHVGFFIGLDPIEGLAHSPLKKVIVVRAHNAYGKVIETQTLQTFEHGECVHSCFDLRKRPDNDGIWGFPDFIKKDRIMKPDGLKDGRLCLSLQIKMLQ